MKYTGKEIERLIPQRPPFMMVDGFEPLSDDSATTSLCVDHNNYFIIDGDELSESGIIEHQAQSVSALAGYKAAESDSPPVGIIGEVKHFECLRRPRIGERMVTTVQMGMTFGNVTMAKCETAIDGETVARINLKVFMQ
ncbi:MAG: beta-hydroxyacyl-ACP dehydratase [Prevotella sp.]|nr:beta-hydroxyacyl-ACP dehydratase [Prevotella sp.]